MVRIGGPALGRRSRWIALGVMAGVVASGLLVASPVAAQTPAPRLFASDGGLVLNFIKPDKTADFEAVMAKVKEALMKSDKPERKQQAASWKVFKSPDAAQGGNALYVFVIDPSVKTADYTVSIILAEAFPQEVQSLYKQFAESYASGQNFVNLSLIADFGK